MLGKSFCLWKVTGKGKPLSIAQTWIPKGVKMSYKNFAACFKEVTTLIKVNTALIGRTL